MVIQIIIVLVLNKKNGGSVMKLGYKIIAAKHVLIAIVNAVIFSRVRILLANNKKGGESVER